MQYYIYTVHLIMSLTVCIKYGPFYLVYAQDIHAAVKLQELYMIT